MITRRGPWIANVIRLNLAEGSYDGNNSTFFEVVFDNARFYGVFYRAARILDERSI